MSGENRANKPGMKGAGIMGAEETGIDTQEPAENASGEATAAEGAAETQEPAGEVTDSHGQPGINKERHDREIAEKDAKIAELEAKLEESAKTAQGRADLKAEIDALKKEQAEERIAHKLELAGCVDVKAAKARLDDFDGDVDKLKSECPYLFEEKRKPGTTELPPTGTAKGPAKTIREALRG